MINENVDMHVHTTASDGSFTPEMLILSAKKCSIGFLSVTDHDSVQNTAEIERLCRNENIAFVRGVEISSMYNGEIFHILGYDYDIKNSELISLLSDNQRLMEKKDDDCIKTLIENGYDIDFLEYKNYEYDHTRGGWKALNFLIDKGICSSVDEFFGKIFCDKMNIYFPEFPHPRDVINIIKQAHGKAVLAHPMYGLSKIPLVDMLEIFKEFNIDGIECYHPKHNIDVTKKCIRWCTKNNMLITGGSDCHGTFIPSRKVGVPVIKLWDIKFYENN